MRGMRAPIEREYPLVIDRYANRDTYRGKLVGGQRVGYGELVMAGGHVYKGLW